MTVSTPPIPPPPHFPTDARMVVRALRNAFANALASIGVDPNEPQAISRHLGLNKNLAWKISKIVEAEDPAVAIQQMPGAAGINIFLRALERAGATAIATAAVREAAEDFERLIQVHSGDRATLEMMGGMLSPNSDPQRDEQHRKLLFQGASYVWGVQARVLLKVGLVAPSSQPDMLDFASVNSLTDFRRIRPNVTWVMASRHANFDDGSAIVPRAEPIDPRFHSLEHAPLMGDYCSQPLPEFQQTVDDSGVVFELVEGPVGDTAAITCTFGMIQRGIPAYGESEDDWGRHIASCDTPAELLIVDLLIHKEFAFAIPPQAALCSLAGVPTPPPVRGRRYLPLNDQLQDLGTGPIPAATPQVSHYAPMLQSVYGRTGWKPEEFHGFRMKIAYPAFPTAIELRYRLPVKR